MSRGSKYPIRQRTEAVGIAIAAGSEHAANVTGIPRRTIDSWKSRPEYAELCAKTREDVADMFWAAIQIGADQVAQGLLGDAPLRDKATALGILYDKHALLTGMATARTESRDLTGTLADTDVAAAIRAADEIAAGGRTPQAVEGTPAGEGLQPIPD